MSNNKHSLVDEYRSSRTEPPVILMTFINDYFNHKSNSIFCFFEGEDGKYYNKRIMCANKTDKKLIPYVARNKKAVSDLHRLINESGKYNDSITLFFMDRDYSNDITKENLYVTPKYSIENFYTTLDSFSKIIETEFYINQASSLYKDYQNIFLDRLKEFHNYIFKFNVLCATYMKIQNPKNTIFFNNYKTNDFVEISLSEVKKAKKYDSKIGEITNLIDSEKDITNTENEFKKSKNMYSLFRGKNELDFFVNFLNNLKEHHNNNSKKNDNFKKCLLNLTDNRLSELSSYADTPDCLINFLNNHIG